MTPEEAIRDRLLAISAVTTLVGTRIYQLTLPQSVTWPAIRVQLISLPIEGTVDGKCSLGIARVQVDAFVDVEAETNPYTAAIALADAIHGNGLSASPTGLHNWGGAVGSPPVTVKRAARLDRDVTYEVDAQRLIRVRQDYQVWAAV